MTATSSTRDKRVHVGDLTRKEFRQRLQDGAIRAAVVPTAATEQHNEHLEMTHDALHVTHVAAQAARRLRPQVVVSPTVGIGVSEHWMEHAGTLTVRPEIFSEYVFDVCLSLARAGIANILILNGHGGNVKPLMRRIGEFRDRLGSSRLVADDLSVNLRFQSYWDVYDPELVAATMENGRLPGHADEYETSMMLALAPERVHADDMDNESARLGTREKGEALLEPAVVGVVEVLEKMMAGQDVDLEPVTFRPEGRLHMITGEPVE